ncbi:hypothetical protein [Sphaerotilus microaerophilus]|uniref:Helix-turn-helix domain-containing protein n=1 Tax=Sphaerotilus microaerophilus TaxID=2914710 RepID=A0ABN6PPH5_9BURK|nr:hypothetical protein [Sphaerotilus sp. FB-5]BDI07130.1 hypothetical protein CATMQ487_41000 [Sphaerotilus sp. FB-5]
MQTDPRNEKGRDAHHGDPTHMQTGADCACAAADIPAPTRRLTPRRARLLAALLDGPKTREQLDRAAGTSNSPDVVMILRRDFGLVIDCEHIKATDRDGEPCRPGVYSLRESDRAKVNALLKGVHA